MLYKYYAKVFELFGIALFGALILSKSEGATDVENEIFDFTNLTEFPKNFLFSTSTASYQIEGAWNVNGKGENIWDRLTHTKPEYVKNGDNGDIACDSYHKYKEDVQLIKNIGFNMYRFSLSWSRLFPTGYTNEVNPDGVRYYSDLIKELKTNGIEPMVTLYHWDLPQPLEDIGGWLNPEIVEIFGDYAREIFKLFGKNVKWWLTINEPSCVTEGYGKLGPAPSRNLPGTGEYLAGHNILRAHAKAYRIYEREFKKSQGGKISITLYSPYFYPKNPSDPTHIEAAERGKEFLLGWFAHPIFSESGDYPPVMREYVDKASKAEGRNASRLPVFTDEEIQELKGSYDFFGINHYFSRNAQPGISNYSKPSIANDQQIYSSVISGSFQSECEWLQITPKGFRDLLNWIKTKYNNPDMFITENGYCDSDKINDIERIHYYTEYMKQLLLAINEDKCNVLGYTVWSLLDNFEWNEGYSKRFGIIRVDFNDPERTRTMKLSAKFFKKLFQMIYRAKNEKSEL